MGGLVSLFNSEGGGKSTVDVFLDFESAKPTEGKEQALYDEVHAVLTEGATILSDLTAYRGCEEFIRQAIAKPSPENDKAAWAAIIPAVNQLKTFYEYSKKLEIIFPKLMSALCSDNAKDSLSTQQALAKQLADVFDFVLRFDDAKMVNPGIQNDFSYYRRSMNRMKQNKETAGEILADDLANRMSLFLAYPTPMMRVLTDLTASDKTVAVDNVVMGLSMMANICYDMVAKKKFTNVNTNMFCLRAMTGCVVLVDNISPVGAFSKKSAVQIKGVITVLKSFTDAPTDGMLNALRFNTKHLNDPETPGSIKTLLS